MSVENSRSGSIVLVSTEAARLALPDPDQMGDTVTVELGAQLFAAMPRAELIAWIKRFPSLRVIRLADDWIADDQMDAVAADFAVALPGVDFGWTHQGLAGGKHGR